MNVWTQVVVPAVAGIGGGTVASLVTPWAQWGVDKRRAARADRASIIDGARELVHQGQDVERAILLVDPRYLAIRAHMREEAEQKLREAAVTVVSDAYGTVGNPYLAIIRDEADRLERQWGLR